MNKLKEEYNIVLGEMPIEFSTNMFIDQLRKLGVSDKTIELQHHIGFLLTNCDRISNRLFRKKTINTLNENMVIEFLNIEGFKKDYKQKILLADLHNQYLSYCKKNDLTPYFLRDFNKKLTQLGFLCKRYAEGLCVHVSNNQSSNSLNSITINELTIDQAVEFLKYKGYKILQPITEYKEL